MVQDPSHGAEEADEEVVVVTKEVLNEVFEESMGDTEGAEEQEEDGSLGGSDCEPAPDDLQGASEVMMQVEDLPSLPKNEAKQPGRSHERSAMTSNVQSMVRSAAESFGSVGTALISSIESQHREVLRELEGEKKSKRIPIPELKMQSSAHHG